MSREGSLGMRGIACMASTSMTSISMFGMFSCMVREDGVGLCVVVDKTGKTERHVWLPRWTMHDFRYGRIVLTIAKG